MQKKNITYLAFGSLALLECLFWGFGSSFTKIALQYSGPFWMLAVRFSLTSLLFLAFFGKRIFKNFRKMKTAPALLIGVCNALSFIFANLALNNTSATTSGFLFSIGVIFTPFLSWLILKKRFDLRVLPIIALVVFGLYLLCGGESFVFGFGELCAVLSSFAFALTLTLSSKLLQNSDWVVLSFIMAVTIIVICWPLALLFEPAASLFSMPLDGVISVLYLTIFSSFLAYIFQNIALGKLPAVLASLIFCSESVFSAIAARLMLGEQLSITGTLGAAIVVVGIVLATLVSNLPQKAKTTVETKQSETVLEPD